MSTPDLLDTAQTCEELGVHQSTLSRWIRRGRIAPAVKGRGVRGPHFFARADVDRLKADRGSAQVAS